ncbi:MAG: [protein-PII] uridylyltransferase, partial [Moraxellaceae bacterium]
ILHRPEVLAACEENIGQFFTFLWDIKLEIGSSVRTVKQCIEIARNDITVATNIMESRTLVGDESLRHELLQQSAPNNIWPADAFFRAKWDEQIARHKKYNDTEYNLEPNIKNAPGGLRDIQTISWVAKRYFQVRTLKQLEGKGFFTEEEFSLLYSGEEYLWRVRYGLHMVAKRAEERLMFDYQRELAKLFGFEDEQGSLAVEQFMHKYYRTVLALRELNDVLLQFLSEAILQKGKCKSVISVNERFQLRDNYIEATHTYIFEENPSALLEMFVLMAQNPDIVGVRASTIRLVRESRHLIDEDFRNNPKNTQLFVALLQHPAGLVEQLKRMLRYGILGLYLPEFGQVTGQMQHDLFHIYTVDAHTLKVVQNMCNFLSPSAKEEFPIAAYIMTRLPRLDLLYMAGLYHDIGKGRGGDHSTLGAVDAELFCRRHGISPRETRLVSWLVEKHLLMSSVSQKQDLSDPDVIRNFALTVGDQMHLDYLYALTVADINGTNRELWN